MNYWFSEPCLSETDCTVTTPLDDQAPRQKAFLRHGFKAANVASSIMICHTPAT